MRHLLSVILLSVMFTSSFFAQEFSKENYFVQNKKDTTYCQTMKLILMKSGDLVGITYSGTDGVETKLNGKELSKVKTISINGVFHDLIPLKADKPDGHKRMTEREVDGKLKIYASRPYHSDAGPVGSYRFFLQMPNGTFYKINSKKNINNYIKPYLLKCKEFEAQYMGDYSYKEDKFKEMIELYNSLCN